MSERATDLRIEGAVTARRERDVEGRIVPSPGWWDLSPEDLDALFLEQTFAREVERVLDPQGMSGTVRAVLAVIAG